MPDKFGWPTLPAGARYLDPDETAGKTPPEAAPDPKDTERQVGSMLREIMGPAKPEPPLPGFYGGVVEPVAKKVAQQTVMDPVFLGTTLASMMFPGGPGLALLGKVAPKAVGPIEALGSTGLRRLAIMTGVGAAVGGPSGGFQGLVSQLGGEATRKLSQFAMMNSQAKQLAQSDPETLGKVVNQIIPGLGEIRTKGGFNLAFKRGAAQTAASESFARGIQEIDAGLGGELLPSQAMSSLRGPAKVLNMQQDYGGTPAGLMLPDRGQPGKYAFQDIADTIKRLRSVGWNKDEIARGLGAMDARETSIEMANELTQHLPPHLQDKWSLANGGYMRAQRIIDLLDDPKVLAQDGTLNMPRLQEKFKAEGYNVRQSYQLASDAADLETALFRGASQGGENMAEDVAAVSGKYIHGFRMHLGIIPSFHIGPLPIPGKFAGTPPPGLSPFEGGAVGQLLRQGIKSKANTLKSDED